MLINQIRKKSNYPHQTKSTTALQSHYHLMPSLYLTKELTSSPPPPLPASLLPKKLSLLKSTQHSVHSSTRRTTPPESKHQTPQSHFAVSILTTNSFIHFLHLIDYVDNTILFTKEFLQPAKYRSIIYPILSSIYPPTASYIPDIQNDNDIINFQWLTKTWAGA